MYIVRYVQLTIHYLQIWCHSIHSNERDVDPGTSVRLLFPCCKTFQSFSCFFAILFDMVFSSETVSFLPPQIRNMAEKVPSFQTGGALWFTDLTTPDSLYILPVITALTFLITVEVQFHANLLTVLTSLTIVRH